MRWVLANRFDPAGAALADRHYSRQTAGGNQFMPSGRALVLITEDESAVWGTSWQMSHDGTSFAKHAWPLAWNCSIFRNEGPHLSSELITEAVSATRYVWGDPPEQGFVTFVDPGKVRRKRDPGRCYLKAGWKRVGVTGSGKVALQLEVDDFPPRVAPIGATYVLFGVDRNVRMRRRAVGFGTPYVDVDEEAS